MRNILDTHFGKQITGLSAEDLLEKILRASTIKEMNSLRENAVAFLKDIRGREILEKWQKKYWSLKTCQTCGRPQ